MDDYKHKDLFLHPHIDKQLKITTDDGLFTAKNEDIHWEDFELTESLCSESELQFGSCEASIIKFQIRNAFIPLIGKWLTVTETLEGNTDTPFQYGRYKVFSDVPTADKEYRDVVAYDAMYDIINADVAAWYNSILPNKDSKITMKRFREDFVRYFGISEVIPKGGLVNDDMIVEKSIESSELSGKDVITAICEINGCFGHIGRDGKFHYIYLLQDIQGLYPADFLFPDHVPEQWDYFPQAETGHLYPQDPKSSELAGGTYISCKYEDYMVRQINKLQIRMEENDIGVVYGEGNNCYIIEDNFLVYGKSGNQLKEIAENIYGKIRGIVYRPFSCEAVGNPCLEVGNPIKFSTKYEIIESYAFTRTLKGIQSLRDSYTASGSERRAEKVNGIQKSIVQLKGKSNVLERNIEETRSEIKDTEQNLQSEIRQTASEIRTEVKNVEDGLSSRITQNANSISAEVTRATGAEGDLSSRITINEQGIATKVSKDNIISEINQSPESVEINASKISLNGNVMSNGWVIDSNGIHNTDPFTGTEDNDATGMGQYGSRWAFWAGNGRFTVDLAGEVHAKNAHINGDGSFSGSISATSGTFENVTIKSNCTVAGKSITGTIENDVVWNGSSIQNDRIGNLNAGKLTDGTVGRPYSYSGVSIDGSVNTSNSSGRNYLGNPFVTGLTAQRPDATIGTSGSRFNTIYAQTFVGAMSSGSSKEIKTNIDKYDVSKCLDVIKATEIMSYNYKNDIRDNSQSIKEIVKEKEEYIKRIEDLPEEEKPDNDTFNLKIKEYENQIEELKNERKRSPETRYGFISEDAPWELVSMDRKTVDTYSAVAMCFGAIQEMSKRIEELENIIKLMNMEKGE